MYPRDQPHAIILTPTIRTRRLLSFVRISARDATFAALIASLNTLVPARVAAQGAAAIAGRVTTRADSGAPAPAAGASVSVVGSTLGATTGADGRFRLEGVLAGPRTVRVRLPGYRTVERALRLSSGDTIHLDVTLVRDAQLLSPISTDARSVDLEMFESKPNVATIALGKAAMAGIPSLGEPDVVRVVQLLPGVSARNDFTTGLNVRGGEADQNLILLDGHPIYSPFHLGGLFSTFMDATVGGIELMTGAFPARYGGRLSSVLDVRSADDARPGVHGSSDISVIGATGRLGGTFNQSRGTWSVAGRRTYADAFTSTFSDKVLPYHFRDLHARATYALPGDVLLALTAYSGKDVFDANFATFASDSAPSRASEGRWSFDWGNQMLGATLSKELGPDARIPLVGWHLGESATIEQRISASGFSMLLDLGDGALAQRSTIRDVRVSGSVLARGVSHDRSIGYELATHRVRYASGSSQTGTTDFDLLQRPTSGAAWLGDLWRLSSRWLVEGGVRAEALTGSGRDWAALSPRVTMKYFVTPAFALTAGGARVTQVMHSLVGDGPLRFFDVWIASDSFVPVAAAWHGVAGAERRVGVAGSVRVEGFLKRYQRVLEANPSEDPGRRGDEFFAAEGVSYGLDLLARWQPSGGGGGGRWGGWIAYTYGVSSRWRDSLRWTPGHDRKHDLNVIATGRLAKYRVGARFGYASGTPYTPILGGVARRVYDPSRDLWGTGNPQIFVESLGGQRNGARYPATHRLDVDVSREFHVRAATIAPYVSVVNAYNAKNVFAYLYQYSTNPPTRRTMSQFPVLPSLGVRVVF